jgi:hypothetical protein
MKEVLFYFLVVLPETQYYRKSNPAKKKNQLNTFRELRA